MRWRPACAVTCGTDSLGPCGARRRPPPWRSPSPASRLGAAVRATDRCRRRSRPTSRSPTTRRRSPVGTAPELEGTLDLQDGCLVVLPAHDGTQEPVVPVVPVVATTWDGTTLTVNASSAAVGEEISLGGGFHARPPDGAFVPESCPPATTDRYLVVGLE